MKCAQCPVSCGVERQSAAGGCGVKGLKIAKYYLHPFEEPPISFKNGSGCIFFCGCSLQCVFCQNFDLSRNLRGKEITVVELASIFKELQDMGAENINLVNPTHYTDEIIKALKLFRPKIPIVWNTHGYEKAETLERASEFVDIWLADLKFCDPFLASRYTKRRDYADFALPAAEFMAKKPLTVSDEGKMLSGCIIRHLVLPQAVYDTKRVVEFVSRLPDSVYLSLMSQYTPYGEAEKYPELNRKITRREYNAAVGAVRAAGIKNVFIQDYDSASEKFIPEWDF